MASTPQNLALLSTSLDRIFSDTTNLLGNESTNNGSNAIPGLNKLNKVKLYSISIHDRINKALVFLNESCDPIKGFQNTCVGSSRQKLIQTEYPEEIFTSLMAIDLLSNSLSPDVIRTLHGFIAPEYEFGIVNFNKYTNLIPDDVEDTSLVHYLRLRDGYISNAADKRLIDVVRAIVLNTNNAGIIELYFPPKGFRSNRLDPSCLSNAMRILYATGWDIEATPTEDYLYSWLESRQYLTHFSYYPSPDTFLYFVSKTVALSERAKQRFLALLSSRILDRLCTTTYPLDISMRLLALDNLGLLNDHHSIEINFKIQDEVENLCCQQIVSTDVGAIGTIPEGNGNKFAWPKDALFKKGRSDVYFGGNIITTIFAVAALEAYVKYFGQLVKSINNDNNNN